MTAIGLDIANLSLVQAAEAVRQGEVSAVALLEACLANLDAHEEAVNATIWVDREGAFAAAGAADAEHAAGGPIGSLHGVPLAHKDMYYQAGRLSTCGSAIRKDFVPSYSATVIERLAAYQFPVKLNEVSRGFFDRSATLETGALAEDMRGALKDPPDSAAVAHLSAVPFYNSKLRTTCVATMMAAGHAENALPQAARVTVNCRILPGEPAAEVATTLRRLAGDDRIALRTVYVPIPSPPSPLTPAIMGPLERLVAEQFPNVPIVPVMEAGATDGLFLRNAGIPTYGVSAVFEEQNDVRAHGRDERLRVQSFYEALEFWYRMMQAYASDRLTP